MTSVVYLSANVCMFLCVVVGGLICSNFAAVCDRSTADRNGVQCPHSALPHLRRFRLPASHVSESRDPNVLRSACYLVYD